jgi:hypothetical protein
VDIVTLPFTRNVEIAPQRVAIPASPDAQFRTLAFPFAR